MHHSPGDDGAPTGSTRLWLVAAGTLIFVGLVALAVAIAFSQATPAEGRAHRPSSTESR